MTSRDRTLCASKVSSTSRDVGIALLGYGTVGSAVHRLLEERSADISSRFGIQFRVIRALVRDPLKERRHPAPRGMLTKAYEDLRDPDISIVVEAMGGLEPTRAHLLAAIGAGRHVVTANKQVVAWHGEELTRAAGRANVMIRYEAAVCAAVPILRVLRTGIPPLGTHTITGVVNGTTNYILGEMERGVSFDEALADAQALGYAESEPEDDLSGSDAAAKMVILGRAAFGAELTMADVEWSGIDHVRPAQVVAAKEAGHALRLVGTARRTGDGVEIVVEPVSLPGDHPLAALRRATNGVVLEGPDFGRLTLIGPGAGGRATASAVLTDLLEVVGA
jgi:homoserine dehydrogenase